MLLWGKIVFGDVMIKLFTPFIPMEPVNHPTPFDDETYGFQIKWDGTRIIAHIAPGKIQLFNRKKHIRTNQYPEITSHLSVMFGKSEIILDGEVIALIQGKPNFQQLMRRDWTTDPATIKHLISKVPVTYVVFDILYLNNNLLIDKPFRERDKILHDLVKSVDPVVLTDTFCGQGKLLFDIVKKQQLEGIVAKKLDSRYQVGKKNDKWLKIKNKRQLTATIGGFLYEGREVHSLLLGIYEDSSLIYIGRASSGLKANEARELFDRLHDLVTHSCPFSNPIPLTKHKKPMWVKPEFNIVVEYMDFTDDGLLRHPVIKQIKL